MAIEIKNYGTFAGPGSGDGIQILSLLSMIMRTTIPFKQMIQTLLLLMNLTSLSV